MSKPPSMTPRQLVRLLRADGWAELRSSGSHAIFTHPTKPGKVVVPMHARTMKPGILNAILGDAGIKP